MTTAELSIIKEGDQALLDATKQEFDEIMVIVEKHMVTDDATMEKATDMVSLVKKGNKALEAKRKERVEPLNVTVKQINSMFNGLRDEGLKAVGVLERQMTSHLQKKEREERLAEIERKKLEQQQLDEEQAELKELESLGDESASTELVVNKQKQEDLSTDRHQPKKQIARGQVGRASMVEGKLEITILDITKVPKRYLQLNETAVRATWNAGTRNIEGLSLKKEQTLRTA